MMELKGDNVKDWNWQMREPRIASEQEAEEEYLKNVELISHQDEIAAKIKGRDLSQKGNQVVSTKESSEKSQE